MAGIRQTKMCKQTNILLLFLLLFMLRLTQDVIYEEYPDMELSDTRTLTLSNSAIKSVDLTPLDVMNNLVRYM